jgi:hypothetical protein
MAASTRCEVSGGERLALRAISGRVYELFAGGEGEPAAEAQDARHPADGRGLAGDEQLRPVQQDAAVGRQLVRLALQQGGFAFATAQRVDRSGVQALLRQHRRVVKPFPSRKTP